MFFKEDEKQKIDLTTVCTTCGKPIAGKLPRTDVTRYLFQESRCQCASPDSVKKEDLEIRESALGLPDSKSSTPEAKDKQPQEVDKAEHASHAGNVDWQAVGVANLPDYYEDISLIGEGGMGAVYKVRDKRLDKIFAIKLLRPQFVQDSNAIHRFEQEAKAASSLTHVNLVSVYDSGIGKQGAPYLVMEYLPGKNLGELIAEQGYIEVKRAIGLFLQIAEAIEHAHEKGVLHRDIKPTNIIIEQMDNGIELVKLFDFGIAKVLATENLATQGLTQTGAVLGSPLYMSPEQGLGNQVDARSDIYAFGCVMYETLYGKPPFQAENPIRTIMKHIQEKPILKSSDAVGQSVPNDMQFIILRCLEKEPLDRYQSIHYLKNDLQLVIEHKGIYEYKKLSKIKDDELKAARLELLQKDSELTLWRRQIVEKFNFDPLVMLVVLLPCVLFVFLLSYEKPKSWDYSDIAQHTQSSTTEQAIPFLEQKVKASRDLHRRDTYLADNLQNVGNCYKTLGQFEKALPYYSEAWDIYRENPYQTGSSAPQCAEDYSAVLHKLHRDAEADQIKASLPLK